MNGPYFVILRIELERNRDLRSFLDNGSIGGASFSRSKVKPNACFFPLGPTPITGPCCGDCRRFSAAAVAIVPTQRKRRIFHNILADSNNSQMVGKGYKEWDFIPIAAFRTVRFRGYDIYTHLLALRLV